MLGTVIFSFLCGLKIKSFVLDSEVALHQEKDLSHSFLSCSLIIVL